MVGKATRFGVTVLLCVGSGQNLLSWTILSAHSVWHWLDTVKKTQFMPEKKSFFQQNHVFTKANQVEEIGKIKDIKVSRISDLDVWDIF